MTITSEIERIRTNIANAYDVLYDKGAVLPETENSANLASTINTLPSEESGSYTPDEPVLQDITVRQNGTYEAESGYDGLGEVNVGVGQVGETYEAENLTGNNINQYDKVWLNYRQMHIIDSYTDNSVDGHSSVGNSIGFICDKTTSNLYYNAYS